jgi:IS605 OrfB family transposase
VKRTVSIKLATTPEQFQALCDLQAEFAKVCNHIVPVAVEHRCWNRVALHHRVYYPTRAETALGSQMVCNAVQAVADAYKVLHLNKTDAVPVIRFKDSGAVQFDKRTYGIKSDRLSLYTLTGRILVAMRPGDFQLDYLQQGTPKEATLIRRRNTWFFNLVLDLPEATPATPSSEVLGVDIGENNLAATSTGKVWGGGDLRHRRDRYLALRRRLQSNGSQSARQKLRQVSGKERRRVQHVNHETSKAIVAEAVKVGVTKITMEDLTHIRARIKAGKRMRGRLHRWAFRQLQTFVEYKANAHGIAVKYVEPAYTSQTCSCCGELGRRSKHRFVCEHCGLRAHSDLNASRNLARIGKTAVLPRAVVNTPDVGCVVRHASP